jgi:hypothetical protein
MNMASYKKSLRRPSSFSRIQRISIAFFIPSLHLIWNSSQSTILRSL